VHIPTDAVLYPFGMSVLCSQQKKKKVQEKKSDAGPYGLSLRDKLKNFVAKIFQLWYIIYYQALI
jgi:hypothetical protein